MSTELSSPQRNELRVFLSSTFRDMTHERDYLNKTIFPKIKRIARERRVEFTAVDLRWGVTEEEAQQGKVVEICLSEIDRCKPFFLGFLGERYGWAPSEQDIDRYEDLISTFPIVKTSLSQGLSVTEMEIVHGVLEAESQIEAAFYQRTLACTQELAEASVQSSDYFEPNLEGQQKLSELKAKLKQSRYPIRSYSDIEVFGQVVYDDLLATLDRIFPESEVKSELEATRLEHRAYAEDRAARYLPQQDSLDALDRYLVRIQDKAQNERLTPLVIGGESGLGKSALLSYWLTELNQAQHNLKLIEHFPGVSGDATPESVLSRLILETKALNTLTNSED